jgi:L-serine dehydratase
MSAVGVFDLFKIGIGPSSSHTVGPMRAAREFVVRLKQSPEYEQTAAIRAELYGSLGATGKGHGADKAVMMGLLGETPESVEVDAIAKRLEDIRARGKLKLLCDREVDFVEPRHLLMFRRPLPRHPNGMAFVALDKAGIELRHETWYSLGGGFIADEKTVNQAEPGADVPHSFSTAKELLEICEEKGKGAKISDIMLANEKARAAGKSAAVIKKRLLRIWTAMDECIRRGCEADDTEPLPGVLKVKRRAPALYQKLSQAKRDAEAGEKAADPLAEMDWANLYAIAVNEENAAGGRVVTAPTNGAAGIVPAVLRYFMDFRSQAENKAAREDQIVRFLLTAAAIGALFKKNASISGAEVGCQGEVGSACSMAAGALAEAMGANPRQVENAAEIAMEHHLGLTCDPIAGLVQIPCIERNAIGATKAITAARIALAGDGSHFVSLDRVIKTMWETGKDMKVKYKETARGGLAVHAIDGGDAAAITMTKGRVNIPVNVVDC